MTNNLSPGKANLTVNIVLDSKIVFTCPIGEMSLQASAQRVGFSGLCTKLLSNVGDNSF